MFYLLYIKTCLWCFLIIVLPLLEKNMQDFRKAISYMLVLITFSAVKLFLIIDHSLGCVIEFGEHYVNSSKLDHVYDLYGFYKSSINFIGSSTPRIYVNLQLLLRQFQYSNNILCANIVLEKYETYQIVN